jgi:hypothetical protein
MRRRAIRRCREPRVAAAATTSARDHQARIGVHELAEPLPLGLVLAHDRAGRDADDDVGRASAMRLAPHATPSGSRAEVAPAVEVAQGRHAGLDLQDHVAAVAAVAAIGAAARHVGLAPERASAVAASPGGDVDARAIGEARHQGEG